MKCFACFLVGHKWRLRIERKEYIKNGIKCREDNLIFLPKCLRCGEPIPFTPEDRDLMRKEADQF